jgi:DNA repair protein RecO (recombination protein O)
MADIIYKQPGFIIHQINFGDSSKILKVLTRDYGMVSLLSKGIRYSKKYKACTLTPFVPLLFTYRDNNTISVLNKFESTQEANYHLKKIKLICALYVNEILYRSLSHSLGDPKIFYLYYNTLKSLQKDTNTHKTLRTFEFALMEILGFNIDFAYDFKNKQPVEKDRLYNVIPEHGVTQVYNKKDDYYTGDVILQIHYRQFNELSNHKEIKKIAHKIISFNLKINSPVIFRDYS